MHMNLSDFGRFLLLSGVVLVMVGIFFVLLAKVPFLGRLPGDIHWMGKNWSIHIPIVTCLILSILVTIIFNIIIRK